MKKSTILYSLLPPLGIWYGLIFYYTSFLAPILFILNILLNTLILAIIILIVLKIFKSAYLLNKKSLIIISLITTLFQDVYTFIAGIVFYIPPQGGTAPFSYHFTPDQYNTLSIVVISGIISLCILTIIFAKKKLPNYFAISLIISIINLPWIVLWQFNSHQAANLSFLSSSRGSTISQNQVDQIKQQISLEVQSERLVPDSNSNGQYNSIEITSMLKVPVAGKYTIQPILVLQSDRSPSAAHYADANPFEYYINGKYSILTDDIQLQPGPNAITVTFPYTYTSSNDNQTKISLQYDGESTGTYGPYYFSLYIYGVTTEDNQIINFDQKINGFEIVQLYTNEYQTKTYTYQDFLQ